VTATCCASPGKPLHLDLGGGSHASSSQAAQGGFGELGGSSGGPAHGTAPAGASGGVGPGALGSGTAGLAAVGSSGSAGGPTTSSGAGAGGGGPATVKLGVVVADAADSSVVSAFGLKGEAVGDPQAEAQAIIGALNAEGGIGGHRIVPVYYPTNIDSGTYSGQAQATCTAFTEDSHVAAVIGVGVDIVDLVSCLAQHNTPVIATPWVLGAIGLMDHVDMQQYAGSLYWPNQLDPDAYTTIVDNMVSSGFLGHGDKIGLVRTDTPDTQRITDDIIEPRLAAHGLSLTDDAVITVNNSVADIGGPAAQISNAVLRFNTDGVNRVFFLGGTSSGPFFFMPEANSQGYRPRYFLTSWDMPYFDAANVPDSQLAGAQGVGWEPGLDVDLSHEPPPSAATTQCLNLMHTAGLAITDPDIEGVMTGFCDAFTLLREGLVGTTSLTPATLRAGIANLTTFPTAETFTEGFAPGRVAGVTSFRDLTFESGCQCFQYTSGPISVGS